MRQMALLVVGAVATLAGAVVIAGQVLSGGQPWGPTLTDNLVFARSIPFTLGLGVVVGALRGAAARGSRTQRRADGAIRRFSPGTAVGHWVLTLGAVLALVTGSWQYLKGVLDVSSPVSMPLVYRVHYLGATLMLFAVSSFLSYWWARGDTALLVPAGQWVRHLRGLAHELPRPLGAILAGVLGLDMRRQAPAVEQFTYYEKTVSLPTWAIAIGLLVVTGLLKALRYIYPLPPELLWWASAIHVGAMVVLAVKLLDHLRYVFAPSRWPLFTSMLTTWVGEGYVRLRHAAWYRAIEQPAAVSPPQAPPVTPPVRPSPPMSPPAQPAVGTTPGGTAA